MDDAKAQVNETLDKIAGQIDAATEEARQVQAELEDAAAGCPQCA